MTPEQRRTLIDRARAVRERARATREQAKLMRERVEQALRERAADLQHRSQTPKQEP